MNIFRKDGSRRPWRFKCATAGVAVLWVAISASAIDPHRTVSQYLRDSWGVEKGFPGSISAIAQTPDGYLWIGSDKGLIRFDGLYFQKFERASPSSLSNDAVQALKVDRQGNLWVLLRSTKLLRYHDGIFELSRGEAENGVTAIGQQTGGAILLSSLAMGTLTYDGSRFLTVSPAALYADSAHPAERETPDQRSARLSWSYGNMPDRLAAPTSAVVSIAASGDGKIWLGTEDRGLFYLQGGRISAVAGLSPGMKVSCLLPVGNSELFVGTSQGVVRWNGVQLTRSGVPSSLMHVEVLSMLRDRDANIWVGTTHGLLRFNANGVFPLSTPEDSPVTALFEDREGNLWIGGTRGLERLRDSAFVSYTVTGAGSQNMGPVYIDPDNRAWVAPIGGGLRWLKGGETGAVIDAGLNKDIVYSITGSKRNDLWVGRQRGGLTHLRYDRGSYTAETYTQKHGLAQNSVYAVYESRDGTVWAGTLSGGVSELRNGHFTNFTSAEGLASNTVSSIAEAGDGTMWFGTPNGLSELSKDGWRSYGVREGLASPDVNCLLLDSTGVLWIGTAEGLAWLTEGKIRVPQGMPDSLRKPIFGMAEDRNGELWVVTASHVLQVKRSSLSAGWLRETEFREYRLADSLAGSEGVKRYKSVVADSQGQIWFSTNRGLSVVNPERGTVNPARALVHIEAVTLDGSPLDFRTGPIRFSAGKHRTTFRYVGLSLGNAERVRYRYRLDGFDQGWSEPVTNREATYANLGVGSYRFRVMASNSDGMWNGQAATIEFEVQPTPWQTWWFRLACVALMGLLILVVYRLRMHRLTRLLNVRFEERLGERTRIAQELHDTLLQGVVSVSMQLHVAAEQLSDDSLARPTLNRALKQIGQVVEEGRNTLRGLRSSIDSADDLKSSLSLVPEELGNEAGCNFRVVVEGAPKPLRSGVRDEVYRIAREALVNAFRYSGANNIDLYLKYSAKQLRIVVCDDGRGVDAGSDSQRAISAMRERAKRIGIRVKVLSRAEGGAEVDLRVPSNIAFEHQASNPASRWLAAILRRERKVELSLKDDRN